MRSPLPTNTLPGRSSGASRCLRRLTRGGFRRRSDTESSACVYRKRSKPNPDRSKSKATDPREPAANAATRCLGLRWTFSLAAESIGVVALRTYAHAGELPEVLSAHLSDRRHRVVGPPLVTLGLRAAQRVAPGRASINLRLLLGAPRR